MNARASQSTAHLQFAIGSFSAGCALLTGAFSPNAGNAEDFIVLTARYYDTPRLHLDYTAKHSSPPKFFLFDREEEAIELVDAGLDVDVAYACAASLHGWNETARLIAWDPSLLDLPPLTDAVGPIAASLDALNRYYLPVEYGLNRLIYNSVYVPEADAETLDVFVNPSYAGKTALPAFFDDLASLVFLAQGVTKWDQINDILFEDAINWLTLAHSLSPRYWEDEGELADNLIDGDVLVAWAWNETYFQAKQRHSPIKLGGDGSGASLWSCGYVRIDTGKQTVAKAHDFANSALSESAGQQILEWGGGFANNDVTEAYKHVYPVEKTGIGLPDGDIFLQTPMPIDLRRRLLEAVQAVLSKS